MSTRKFAAPICIVIMIALLFCGCDTNNSSLGPDNGNLPNSFGDKLQAAWVTTVWNIDFPLKTTTDSAKLKKEIDAITAKASEKQLNALFFQVRPCADSFYKSDIFPWSRFLTGKQGTAPDKSFDPLDYFIKKSHESNIQLHAWINPLRVTASSTDTLTSAHPARLFPELTFSVNEKLYFNPGEPAARELIIKGVCEIVQNYDIEGIHYDDYFYPEGITTEDLSTFLAYGSDFKSIADWRRNNIDELISQTYAAVKEINPSVLFGVSPSGIWANKSSNSLGSDTRGFESYYEIYADSRGWVKKKYVDYIAPQIYWYIGQPGCDFLKLISWWGDVCKDTEVALYIGLAGYKIGSGGAWNNDSEIKNQVASSKAYANGYIVFSFGNLE